MEFLSTAVIERVIVLGQDKEGEGLQEVAEDQGLKEVTNVAEGERSDGSSYESFEPRTPGGLSPVNFFERKREFLIDLGLASPDQAYLDEEEEEFKEPELPVLNSALLREAYFKRQMTESTIRDHYESMIISLKTELRRQYVNVHRREKCWKRFSDSERSLRATFKHELGELQKQVALAQGVVDEIRKKVDNSLSRL